MGSNVQAIEAYTCARRLAPDNMRYRAFQDLVLMLALDVPLERPADAEAVLIGYDGRKYRPFHWPQEVDHPERLPAAALPPAIIDNMIPPFTLDMTPGTVADALLPKLPQLMDERWVEGVRQQIAMEQVFAEAMRDSTMACTRHEAMWAEVDRINAINKTNQQRQFTSMAAPHPTLPEHSGMIPFPQPQVKLPGIHPAAQPSPSNDPFHGFQTPKFPVEWMQSVAIAAESAHQGQVPHAFLTRAN
jgi:hypothetical protein